MRVQPLQPVSPLQYNSLRSAILTHDHSGGTAGPVLTGSVSVSSLGLSSLDLLTATAFMPPCLPAGGTVTYLGAPALSTSEEVLAEIAKLPFFDSRGYQVSVRLRPLFFCLPGSQAGGTVGIRLVAQVFVAGMHFTSYELSFDRQFVPTGSAGVYEAPFVVQLWRTNYTREPANLIGCKVLRTDSGNSAYQGTVCFAGAIVSAEGYLE